MSEVIHGKLFEGIIAGDLADDVNLQFLCPVCGYAWHPELSLGTNSQEGSEVKQKISFTIPVHEDVKLAKQCSASGEEIELFVPTPKNVDMKVLRMQHSDTEGISEVPVGWWMIQ